MLTRVWAVVAAVVLTGRAATPCTSHLTSPLRCWRVPLVQICVDRPSHADSMLLSQKHRFPCWHESTTSGPHTPESFHPAC